MALGYWVHPGWFLFTAFVGLNLFQSAFTNSCPAMAIFRKLGAARVRRRRRGGGHVRPATEGVIMKAIMLVTDSEAMREYERVLIGEGHHGFTVVPAVEGSGRHGLKTGDRVHPGSSSLLLTVVGEPDAPPLLQALRRARDDGSYGGITRIWSFTAEEVA